MSIAEAVRDGVLPGRVWMYSNYHCNLACVYCITDSAPGVARRELPRDRMLDIAREASGLGFNALGVTGGEPFLQPWMPGLVAELSEILPVVALSNATLFTGERLEAMRVLAGRRAQVQVSLDRPDPEANDGHRARENFRKVVEAIPRLIERGVSVRLASTVDEQDDEEREELCALHRSLGISDDDHIVRPIVHRGRAAENDMGQLATADDLEPELTITADGAFWSPFGPSVQDGRLDVDLLVTRTTAPLEIPARALLGLVEGRPPGDDARRNIR